MNFSFCARILNYFYRSQVISPQDISPYRLSRPSHDHASNTEGRIDPGPHESVTHDTTYDIDKAFVSFYSLVWRFVLNVYADDHFN